MSQTAPAPAQAAPAPDPAPMLDSHGPGRSMACRQWDKMTPAMFPAAFEEAMAESRAEFVEIRDNPQAPTFADTIVPMELAAPARWTGVQSVWGVYTSNLATKEVQAIDREWSPKLSTFYDELFLDPKLFARVKARVRQRASRRGSMRSRCACSSATYRGFVRRGALLDATRSAPRSPRSTRRSSTAYSEFSRKVLADEETWIVLDSEADLAGLPDSFKASLKPPRPSARSPGWAVVNTRSSVAALPDELDRPRRCARRSGKRVHQPRRQWRRQRHQRDDRRNPEAAPAARRAARLQEPRRLPHGRHDGGDARQRDGADDDGLARRASRASTEEVADMQAIADKRKAPKITIEPWDYRFYAEKVRKAKYDLDESEVKPYLELDNMLHGACSMPAGRLYDLELQGEYRHDAGVRSRGAHLRGHRQATARMSASSISTISRAPASARAHGRRRYRGQQELGGDTQRAGVEQQQFRQGRRGRADADQPRRCDDAVPRIRPCASTACCRTSPIRGWPARRATSSNIPSQVNENWLLTRDVLDSYRQALQDRRADAAGAGRQDREVARPSTRASTRSNICPRAIVDMKLHDRETPVTDVDAFERETLAELGMPKEIVMRHRLPQFNHLFSSDAYSAGYYSLSLVRDDGRRHLGGVRGDRQCLGQDDRRPLPHHPAVDRQRDRPQPKPIAPSAAAIRT